MKKFSPKLGDLVYIRWEDHCSYNDAAWTPMDGVGKRLTGNLCETVGFVVDLTRTHVTTAANVSLIEDPGHVPDVAQIATRLRRAIVEGKIMKRFK